MDIAFSALFIFLLVLPGILCRYWYRKGNWKYPLNTEPLAEETAKSLLLGIALHALWISLVRLLDYQVDLKAISILLIGNDDGLDGAIGSALSDPGAVFGYFVSLYLASAVIGYAAHSLVRHQRLDLKYSLFRFDNPWYYHFSGELMDSIGFVHISAVIQQGDAAYVYFGELYDFDFDRQGNLDLLILNNALRRKLGDDRVGSGSYASRDEDPRYYAIGDGDLDLLFIRYADVRTLNIEYTYFEVRQDPDSPS